MSVPCSTDAAAQPVRYFDRYENRVVEEAIYGERWLRWAYDNPLGRLTNSAILRRAWFSVLYGAWMNTRESAKRVPAFIRDYHIDMDHFESQPRGEWKSFNQFFVRELKAGARPLREEANVLVLPADGRHSAYADGADLSGLVVKGRPFTLEELLGDMNLAERFRGGAMVISRLCPTDYHRFHFPFEGVPSEAERIDGPLDSVNPIAIAAGARSLCANKRELTLLNTDNAGMIALLEVGAACVGRIVQSFEAGKAVAKGQEKGMFLFGGSTTITIFEPGRVTLADDLLKNTSRGLETYARMGDIMATLR